MEGTGEDPDGTKGSGSADTAGGAGPAGAADRAGGAGPAGEADPADEAGPEPSRGDKRLYFVLMAICISLFVISWAVLDRYSAIAAVIVSVVALAIPPFAAIIANVASATDCRR